MLRPILALERLILLEAEGKVYEVDPLTCPKCGGRMKVVAFITEPAVVDRIIDHLKLTFAAEKPPPPRLAYQEYLVDVDPPVDYSL